MKSETFDKLCTYVAHGTCFSLRNAMAFVKELEERELEEKEKLIIESVYEKYRHFGF